MEYNANAPDQADWYSTNQNWGSYEIPEGSADTIQHSSYKDLDSQSYNGSQYRCFLPQTSAGESFFGTNEITLEDEPPLLEELGINFAHIRHKTLSVLNPFTKTDPSAVQDSDLAGPLVFALLFGLALLLRGKVHFGYIYGIGVVGCLGVYLLLNLMVPHGISVTCTVSVIGYCLLPMAILSALAALFSLKGTAGICMAAMAILWCSFSASNLFVSALEVEHQRFLIAYPCVLLYGVFALLAVF